MIEENLFVNVEHSLVKHAASRFSCHRHTHTHIRTHTHTHTHTQRQKESDTWID